MKHLLFSSFLFAVPALAVVPPASQQNRGDQVRLGLPEKKAPASAPAKEANKKPELNGEELSLLLELQDSPIPDLQPDEDVALDLE